MRRDKSIFASLFHRLILAVFCFVWGMGTAHAAAAMADDNALVIIRFNQADVAYEQSLFSAVSQAVATKPSVIFDVVSYAPVMGNESSDAKWQKIASDNTKRVVQSMQKMGIPFSRLRVSGKNAPGLQYDEVHIVPR